MFGWVPLFWEYLLYIWNDLPKSHWSQNSLASRQGPLRKVFRQLQLVMNWLHARVLGIHTKTIPIRFFVAGLKLLMNLLADQIKLFQRQLLNGCVTSSIFCLIITQSLCKKLLLHKVFQSFRWHSSNFTGLIYGKLNSWKSQFKSIFSIFLRKERKSSIKIVLK